MLASLPLPPPPAPEWAWFLDVDGTLIDIAPTPSAIHMPPAMPGLLAALAARHGGALALVSGRTVENILRLVAPFRPPAAGLHGLERRGVDGKMARPEQVAGLDEIRARLASVIGSAPGLLLEDKGLTLALHYRQAPELEQEARRVIEAAASDYPAFRVQAGKMVFEIGPAGFDKGVAVRAFMTEAPFAGRVPVFVGDDVTDEFGFQAVNALGGISVLVGPARVTNAHFRLADVIAAQTWLATAAGLVWPVESDAAAG